MSSVRIIAVKRKLGSGRGPTSSHVSRDKTTFNRAINTPTKIEQNTKRNDCATIVMS